MSWATQRDFRCEPMHMNKACRARQKSCCRDWVFQNEKGQGSQNKDPQCKRCRRGPWRSGAIAADWAPYSCKQVNSAVYPKGTWWQVRSHSQSAHASVVDWMSLCPKRIKGTLHDMTFYDINVSTAVFSNLFRHFLHWKSPWPKISIIKWQSL